MLYRKKGFIVLAVFIFILFFTNFITYRLSIGDVDNEGKDSLTGSGDGEESVESSYSEEYNLLFTVVDILNREYLEEFDREELIEGAVIGLLKKLNDPQTSYLDTDAMDNLLISLKGSFGGIGVRIIDSEEGVIVIEVLPDTPAEEANLQPGDRICAVDGTDVRDYTVEEAVAIIRGEKGSTVTLGIERPGIEDIIEADLVRADIQSNTVKGEMIKPGIGYIKISNFDGTTGDDFLEKFGAMEDEGLDGFILDLRDNPGGVLHEVLKVARELVPEGEIVRIVDRNGAIREIYHSYAREKEYPIAVLINGGSASGSEIIAGALQDHGTAVLVGSPSFGKATVQHFETFENGSGLRYTVAKYVTPSGNDIHGEGIKPDVDVELPQYHRYFYYLGPGALEKGDFGQPVFLLQSMLEALGYNVEPIGYFDDLTESAISRFQQRFDLESHGRFDDITWVYLRQELDEIIHEEDDQLLEALRLIEERLAD